MIILLVYAGVLLAFMLLAVLFYVLSVQSRQRYSCPCCGERVTTEHLNASHCNMCGAPLSRSHDN